MDLQIPLPSLAEQQTLQSDFDEIRHKHAKIAEYKTKAQAAIQRLIPGAAPSNIQHSRVCEVSHSSRCEVKLDGSGCTCRTAPVEPEKIEDTAIAASAAPIKQRKPKLVHK
jgi:hypothetical protein